MMVMDDAHLRIGGFGMGLGRAVITRRLRSLWSDCLLACLVAAPPASAQSLLSPLAGAGPEPPPPWRTALLPQQTLPATRFAVVELDGERVLRVESPASYGNLVHAVDGAAAAAATLRWRWRLERAVAGADLRRREGDDTALKVCVLYAMPLGQVPFVERQLLRLARARSGEDLPAATLCYVWDATLPAGTVIPNAYTPRLRWWVLRGAGSAPGRWADERRDLRADFLRAFGDEATEPPPISAVLVGADADNTGGHGLGYVTGLELLR
jgi:hypothetical protein